MLRRIALKNCLVIHSQAYKFVIYLDAIFFSFLTEDVLQSSDGNFSPVNLSTLGFKLTSKSFIFLLELIFKDKIFNTLKEL